MEKHQFNHRLVILDTETTGINPQDGHRIIEIGCVELLNRRLTGRHFHVYINPERDIDEGAQAVHGISNEFLEDKQCFADIVDEFIAFIEHSELIIHNAPFDVGFINYEFSLLNQFGKTVGDYCKVFDTLSFARKKHPGQRNSLDALCKRYSVDNSQRDLHGALLDAEILADVFLLMTGGQASLLDETVSDQNLKITTPAVKQLTADRPALKIIACNSEELQAHQLSIEKIKQQAGSCLWHQ